MATGSVVLAATNTAPDTTLANVQSTINSSAAGDTVNVPAGGSSWASSLSITKNIYLYGAGTNATHITNSAALGQLIRVALATGYDFRISGFDFNGGWNGGSAIHMEGTNGAAYQSYHPIYGARIDHCLFQEFKSGDSDNHMISTYGRVWGVFDHNMVFNFQHAFEQFGAVWGGEFPEPDVDGTWDWTFVPTDQPNGINYHFLSSTNNWVMEDNCFTYSRNVGVNPACFLASANGTTHYVFRHNLVSDSYANLEQLLEMHGNNYHCCGYFQSVVCAEIYANTFDTTAWQTFEQRGGTTMVFSNTFLNVAGNFDLLEDEICDGGYCGGECPNACSLTYPHMQQVTNTYYWENKLGASTVQPQNWGGGPFNGPGGVDQDTYFVLGRDYWTHAPNSTNVLKDYVPLTYPHPLVGAGAKTVFPPIAPTALRMIK